MGLGRGKLNNSGKDERFGNIINLNLCLPLLKTYFKLKYDMPKIKLELYDLVYFE
jgi:hypothetical protein